ncbi:TadE/TadG family type IV pilus assembly protein [Qipengyuania zhejiangensis]|uniref:TadE/TadG family type IV pilus assembly protein n=1 Tax=Qipengyuania zhejiangensis TaxID=3077782 RepID=UPI002D7A11CB|nr:TadE/TadG family type IV pilus assembly protein [Qipengyuania sp. Z2]
MTRLRAFSRCQSGAAAAELALMLPLLVVMLFGAIEVAYYFYSQHQVVKGVRDGARYASRQSFESINCTSSYAMPTATMTAIQEVTRTGRPSGGTARVPGWVNANVAVAVSCPSTALTTGIYKNEPNAPVVTVTADVDYRSLFDGVGILTDDYDLNATQQAAVMGI